MYLIKMQIKIRLKMKKINGLSPGNYIKEIRLLKSRHLLENKSYSTIREICFSTGFNNPKYFSSIFYIRFGKLPIEYLKE